MVKSTLSPSSSPLMASSIMMLPNEQFVRENSSEPNSLLQKKMARSQGSMQLGGTCGPSQQTLGTLGMTRVGFLNDSTRTSKMKSPLTNVCKGMHVNSCTLKIG